MPVRPLWLSIGGHANAEQSAKRRRGAAMLKDAGWLINDKRVVCLWRREGLKVSMKQPKKERLGLNDGSSVGLRPEYRNHVGSYDCVQHRPEGGIRPLSSDQWRTRSHRSKH